MEFIFLNAAGATLFSRSDAQDAHWLTHEYSLSAAFPLDRSKLIERGMRAAFRDPVTDTVEVFEVRSVSNRDGTQNFTAEHIALAELSDEHLNKAKITEKTAAEALTTALTGTLWAVGTSTASGTQNADISRGSVWDAVNTIQRNWNVYITPRVTISAAGVITGRYLDIVPAGGTFRGLRLSVRKNITDPCVEINDEDVLTALYGYGATVDKARTGQDDEQMELTFADQVWTATDGHPAKPSGQTYLEWPEKTALYGRNGRPRYGYYQNGSIKDPAVLLAKTWEALQKTADPKIRITGVVTDLYRLGYADVPIRLHDAAVVEIEDIGETYTQEVITLDVDLLDEANDQPEIGQYIPNIIYINRDTAKKSGGGGGGGGRGQDNQEEKDEWFDTEIVRQQNLIALVAGVRNGDGYIKAASVVASINDEHGTNVTLNADTIDINGLVTALISHDIECMDLTADGDIVASGSIDCSSLEVDNGIECGALTVPDGDLIVGANEASWMTASIPSFTYSQAHNFVYRLNGQDYTVNGYIIGTKSSTTIHYLGYSNS